MVQAGRRNSSASERSQDGTGELSDRRRRNDRGSRGKGIRDVDQSGSILIVGSEIDPPYKRPPLTKGSGSKSEDKIWIYTTSST